MKLKLIYQLIEDEIGIKWINNFISVEKAGNPVYVLCAKAIILIIFMLRSMLLRTTVAVVLLKCGATIAGAIDFITRRGAFPTDRKTRNSTAVCIESDGEPFMESDFKELIQLV